MPQRIEPKPSGEVIATLIDSLYNDKPADSFETSFFNWKIQAPIYANVMNNGTIPNLPDNIAVETHVKVDGKSIHYRRMQSQIKFTGMSCCIES